MPFVSDRSYANQGNGQLEDVACHYESRWQTFNEDILGARVRTHTAIMAPLGSSLSLSLSLSLPPGPPPPRVYGAVYTARIGSAFPAGHATLVGQLLPVCRSFLLLLFLSSRSSETR